MHRAPRVWTPRTSFPLVCNDWQPEYVWECKAPLVSTRRCLSGQLLYLTWGEHSFPDSIMLKRSPSLKIYCAPSSTNELLQGSLARWDSPAGRCCLYREMEQYGLPVRGITLFAPSILLPLVADYFQWRGIWCTYAAPYAQKSLSLTSRFAVVHTTRNGDAVDDRGYIDPIRNGHAFETTGCIDPFVRWKGHAGKVLQLYQVRGMKAWCLANLSTQKKHPASWPALG